MLSMARVFVTAAEGTDTSLKAKESVVVSASFLKDTTGPAIHLALRLQEIVSLCKTLLGPAAHPRAYLLQRW
jgi:hypothetical protein